MSEQEHPVKAEQLQVGMKILSITKLDSKYSCLDAKSLVYLKAEFGGSRIVVSRNGAESPLVAENLKLFDDVKRIEGTAMNPKFTRLQAETANSLKENGFLEFMVSAPPAAVAAASQTAAAPGAAPSTAPTQAAPAKVPGADPLHDLRITDAKYFLSTLSNGAAHRDKASEAVHYVMEQGRNGRLSGKAAAMAVETITKQGTGPAVVAVAGLKSSDQTYAHCVDMAAIFAESYSEALRKIGKVTGPDDIRNNMLAGFFHDIGKCKVPKEVLDSGAKFDPKGREMMIMRAHPENGAQILSDMGMSPDTINIAHYHHVKKDTTLPNSYPFVSYDKVRPITRFAAIADVYQALIGKRSYKPNWVPGKAVALLMSLKGEEFDEQMLGYFLRTVGIYPVGSLVRLTTGDLAFVVRNDSNNLETPVVVKVETAAGELLTHHELLDLMVEKDVKIQEIVDHFEYYNQSPEQAFQIFSSISI